jgi:hypothetical protein
VVVLVALPQTVFPAAVALPVAWVVADPGVVYERVAVQTITLPPEPSSKT